MAAIDDDMDPSDDPKKKKSQKRDKKDRKSKNDASGPNAPDERRPDRKRPPGKKPKGRNRKRGGHLDRLLRPALAQRPRYSLDITDDPLRFDGRLVEASRIAAHPVSKTGEIFRDRSVLLEWSDVLYAGTKAGLDRDVVDPKFRFESLDPRFTYIRTAQGLYATRRSLKSFLQSAPFDVVHANRAIVVNLKRVIEADLVLENARLVWFFVGPDDNRSVEMVRVSRDCSRPIADLLFIDRTKRPRKPHADKKKPKDSGNAGAHDDDKDDDENDGDD